MKDTKISPKNVTANPTELTVKNCTKCKTEKSVDEFGKSAVSKDGYLSICKVCNQQRSKDYRLRLAGSNIKLVPKTANVDWKKVPVFTHGVRINNDCAIGDYFKHLNMPENFILQINVWDNIGNVQKVIKTHRLYVNANEWKSMLAFNEAEQMKSDLANATDQNWGSFVFKYTKAFGLARPGNFVGLRFKKHGTNGKCVNVGFSPKNLHALEQKFAKP